MSDGLKRNINYFTKNTIEMISMFLGIVFIYFLFMYLLIGNPDDSLDAIKFLGILMLDFSGYLVMMSFVSARAEMALALGATRQNLMKTYPYIRGLITGIVLIIVFIFNFVYDQYFSNAIDFEGYLFKMILALVIVSLVDSIGCLSGCVPKDMGVNHRIVSVLVHVCLPISAMLIIVTGQSISPMAFMILPGSLEGMIAICLMVAAVILEVVSYVLVKKKISGMEVQI